MPCCCPPPLHPIWSHFLTSVIILCVLPRYCSPRKTRRRQIARERRKRAPLPRLLRLLRSPRSWMPDPRVIPNGRLTQFENRYLGEVISWISFDTLTDRRERGLRGARWGGTHKIERLYSSLLPRTSSFQAIFNLLNLPSPLFRNIMIKSLSLYAFQWSPVHSYAFLYLFRTGGILRPCEFGLTHTHTTAAALGHRILCFPLLSSAFLDHFLNFWRSASPVLSLTSTLCPRPMC